MGLAGLSLALHAQTVIYNFSFTYEFHNSGDCDEHLTDAWYSTDGISWQGHVSVTNTSLLNGTHDDYIVPANGDYSATATGIGLQEYQSSSPVYFRFVYLDGNGQSHDTGNAGGGSFDWGQFGIDHIFTVNLQSTCNTNHWLLAPIVARDKVTGVRKLVGFKKFKKQ